MTDNYIYEYEIFFTNIDKKQNFHIIYIFKRFGGCINIT